MRTVIVSVIVLAASISVGLGQDAIPLDKAIQTGKAETAITGIGGSTGDTILVTIRRRVPELLRLTLTPGTVFQSTSGTVQNMAGAAIKGESTGGNSYRPSTEIVLPDAIDHGYIIEAYCLDFHKGNPGPSDRFNILSVDKQAARLLEVGKRKAASLGAIQAALWVSREGLSPAEVQSRFSVSSQEITVARSIISESLQGTQSQPPSAVADGALPIVRADIQVGDAILTQDSCALQNGQVVTNLPKGVRLRVIAINGDWVGCSVLVDGKEIKGWIKRQLVAKTSIAGNTAANSAASSGDRKRYDAEWRSNADIDAKEARSVSGVNEETLFGGVLVTLRACLLRKGDGLMNLDGTAVADLPKGAELIADQGIGDSIHCTALINGREVSGWISRWLVAKIAEQTILARIAVENRASSFRLGAVSELMDQAVLGRIATEEKEVDVRQAAVQRLRDQVLLAKVAQGDKDDAVRATAVSNLVDQALLARFATNDNFPGVRLAAIPKLTDHALLTKSVRQN